MARYGLVVGVAKYKSPLGNLSKTESDAKAVNDLLKQHGNFENIQVLTGDVTAKQLEDALRRLLKDQADRHEALIYFSGHAVVVKGSFEKKRGYFALSNTILKTSSGEITGIENGIALDDLSGLIGETMLSNLMVLLDCCHSETLLEESQGFLQRAIVSQAFAELKQDCFLVSACRKFEEAYAIKSESYSIFTGAMLRGLAKERANDRGVVDASTMFGYVAGQLRGTGQEAVSFGYGRAIPIVHYHPIEVPTAQPEGSVTYIRDHDRNERQTNSVFNSSFVGRDSVLTELDRLFDKNKLILVQGEAGLGKSTVANFYCQRFEFNDFHQLATDGSSDIANAELLVDKWLHEFFNEEVGIQEFSIKLTRLRKYLQNDNRKICFVLDNLEPALANGIFKEENNRYVALLQVLSDPCVSSITLITSRERIYENGINVYTYYLPELDAIHWYEYFQNYQIQVSEESLENPNSALNLIYKAYGGNAECMFVLCGDILRDREEYDNNLEIYWAANREDLHACRTIESLIKRQFERLQKDNQLAYKLLCRMGCYRYQDSINTVPEDGIVAMLWEESKLRAKRTIKDLRDRRLIKFSKQDMGYFLHPVMREEAVSRLKDGCGEWTKEGEEANQKAAVFLKHDIKNVVTQFEAIEHLFCINDTQGVVSILLYNILGAEKLDNIRCSANLWNNVLPIIRIGEKAIKHENILTTDDFALVLTVLGILYSEIGANIKAIKTAEELLKRCEILVNNQSSEKLKFAHLSAYMIQGRAFRLLGNYDKSEIFCQKASKYGQDSKNSIWKGLALYELALAKLEKNEPRKALNCIVVAAFMASGILGLPNGLKKLLFEPIESVGKQLSELITKHEKSDDRTKKFRILYNTAKALNRMAESNDIPPFPIKFKLQNKFFYDLAKTVLDLAGKYVHKEDKGSPVYLYLEYAEYYRNIEDSNKAEGYYQKTLGLFSTMPTICQAMYKRSYCQFKYELGEDEVALAECKQTEILLSETEFYSWTLDNYLMIMELLAKRKDDMNVTEVELADYYRKAQDLCEKIGEPKQYNLNRVNRAFEQRVKQ